MPIKLSRPFASNSAVEEFDLRQMKKTLNRLGYYTPFEKTGITGISDREIFEALKEFQKDNNLPATGTAKPDDETINALNLEADKTPDGYYIWRTVEDGHVRPAHAKFNRTVRKWSDSPDPGDDYNCRCWAEFISNIDDAEKALVNSEAESYIINQKFDRVEKEQFDAQREIKISEADLALIEAGIKKETKDKHYAQNIGAISGATIGAILGSRGGVAGTMMVAGPGISVGKNIGRLTEEAIDALSEKSDTDYSLQLKKQKLLKKIKELQKLEEKLSNDKKALSAQLLINKNSVNNAKIR